MLGPRTIQKYKAAVLGRRFELSISTVSRVRMRTLNRIYRGINSATDILSFPYSKYSGEIVLCPSEFPSHARAFGVPVAAYLPYLVIHGMVHLKGHDHGRIMTRLEERYCAQLGVQPVPLMQHGRTKRSRHRYRNLPGAGSGRTRR